MEAPGLAMSRSLGDKSGREVGVISDPEVYEIILKEEDKFIIIASDGVWEFLSNAEVLNWFVFLSNTKRITICLDVVKITKN